jgi:hypothetical protein
MILAICAALFFGALGSVARFFQGDGHAGPGRWSLYVVCLLAAVYGLHDEVLTNGQWFGVLMTGALAAANVAQGYTNWANIPYSMFRYSAPAFLAVLPWIALGGHDGYLLYVLVGPIIALNQYYLVEHKPQWISNLVGGKDIGTIQAGFFAAAPLALLGVM